MLSPWSSRTVDPFMVRDPFFADVLGDVGVRRPLRTLGASNVCVDLLERVNDYLLIADLPGIPKESIDLQIEANHVVTIVANKIESKEVPTDWYHRQERVFGRMTRSINVPLDANLEQCKATFRDGCLILEIPKLAATAKGGFRKLTIA